jgi:hypothetical protein
MCKANFYDRVLVEQVIVKLLRLGAVVCVLCGGPLTFHSCYPRHIRDEEGYRHDGWIAQGCCDTCKKYPSLIPDFIMPYKHYGAAVVEAAIAKFEENGGLRFNECPADESTVRRWVAQVNERGARAAGWLLSLLFDVYDLHVSALELQNRSLLKQLARLAREIQIPETSGVIGRVNVILTRYNSGFL